LDEKQRRVLLEGQGVEMKKLTASKKMTMPHFETLVDGAAISIALGNFRGGLAYRLAFRVNRWLNH
jgi:hypothetical protein